ncbi:HlyD family secretion protein [Ruminococcus sp. YE71]|uniref:efflux RND transporter periplasmic adaptor subunit n=1 Tax=unclassified Ruminococcus TaxID=2608920 RepID=UPI00087E41E6|nr:MULTISPECIES: efflux RND transporter periplasmic adaptor subunit [unclassified Ruminococcus]SDA27446.1 HlyD family secretion protein [Ruminococcus sp. YE78]SFW45056.1 HlyD family secretion protein [Ruminococcus sp. YE71]
MSVGRKIAVGAIVAAIAAGAGFAGFKLWKKNDTPKVDGTVYVQKVSDVMSNDGLSLSGIMFSGVVEAQKTEDVKYDSTKTLKSIAVKVGDSVKEGDVLFTYDVESMNLELDTAVIEVERLEYDVETKKKELEDMEKLKAKATQDEAVSLEAEILSLKSEIATSEYEVKTKKAANEKLKKSIKNASVTSPTDGVVKEVADLNNFETLSDNIVVKISKGDNYVLKGTVNEMTINNIYVGMPVIIKSRIDDTTWNGTIETIDNNPQRSDQDDYYGSDEGGGQSTKYSFTVEPETLEGLMLGQHIIIVPDYGMGAEIKEKKGIWLYSDYLVEENGKTYVWVKGKDKRIEKREVKVGDRDEDMGDCEIISGLDKNDSIAYPMGSIEEGMAVTTNIDEMDIPDVDFGEEDNGEDMGDMAEYEENEDGETAEGEEVTESEDAGNGEEAKAAEDAENAEAAENGADGEAVAVG